MRSSGVARAALMMERGAREHQRQIKGETLPGEVLPELGDRVSKRPGVPDGFVQRAAPAPEVDRVQSSVVADQRQRPQWRLDHGPGQACANGLGGHHLEDHPQGGAAPLRHRWKTPWRMPMR